MKKEIIFCVPQLYGGGAEQQIKYLANIFSNEFRVKIIVLDNANKNDINSNIEIIKIQKLSFKKIRSLKSFLTLRKIINGNYVISATIYFDILCGFLKFFTNFYWFIRESNSSNARKISFKNNLRKFLGKKAQGIVANSKSGYKYWYLINKNSKLIYNGYPKEILETTKKKKKDFAIVASRMQPHKNIKSSIDLFNKLKKEGCIKKLIIFGEGPEMNKIKKYIKINSNKENIEIKGFISHKKLQEILSYAKYFLSMSSYEGTPNAAIEALANNCELFLSDTSSHMDFFPKSIVNYVNIETLDFKKKNKKDSTKILQFLKECDIEVTFRKYKRFLNI